jgi:hypothetical protein
MALQSDAPSPAPLQSLLMRRLPVARLTIAFSLPPAEAWGRLLGPNRQEWLVRWPQGVVKPRRYILRPHAAALMLDVVGPLGERTGSVQCQIRLIASGVGTTLELESQADGNPYWGLLVAIIWLPGGTLLFGFPIWMSLFALIATISLWYVVVKLTVHLEAEIIESHAVVLLNDNRPGVLL